MNLSWRFQGCAPLNWGFSAGPMRVNEVFNLHQPRRFGNLVASTLGPTFRHCPRRNRHHESPRTIKHRAATQSSDSLGLIRNRAISRRIGFASSIQRPRASGGETVVSRSNPMSFTIFPSGQNWLRFVNSTSFDPLLFTGGAASPWFNDRDCLSLTSQSKGSLTVDERR